MTKNKEKKPEPKGTGAAAKMAATSKAAAAKPVIEKGLKGESGVTPPVQKPAATVAQPASGHPSGCMCRECKKAGKHPEGCQCTKCKLQKKDKPEAAATPAEKTPVKQTQAAGIGTGKVLAEGLNGTAVYSIAKYFGKDPKQAAFREDQLEIIGNCFPEEEIPRSWGLGIAMLVLTGTSNMVMAGKAEIDKDVSTLKKDVEELQRSCEHLKTYAEEMKGVNKALTAEIKELRKGNTITSTNNYL